MSAVVIIRQLLVARAAVTTLVPAARIFTGAIPLGTARPAIGISDISGNEITTVARQRPFTTIRARVQVTVYADSYPVQEQVLLACKLGAGVHTGVLTVGGKDIHVNAVEQMGTGPAIPPGEDKIYERSRDFMVTFKEAN